MKKRNLVLAAVAVVLALSASIGAASAYFTTYARAKGGVVIEMGDRTEIYERVSQWTKHVMIHSDDDSQPVYIRARAFWGETYDISYSLGEGWTGPNQGDWCYYTPVLNGGEDTTELDVVISNVPDNVTEGASFNIIVVSESTPVLYREDGTAYADWNTILDTHNWPAEGGDE